MAREFESIVKEAANLAAYLMRQGRSPQVAIRIAARKFNIDTYHIASECGRRGAAARKKKIQINSRQLELPTRR